MAAYMFLFILAMMFFLTDARPYHTAWSGMKDYDNIIDDEINRLFNEQKHRERQLSTLNRLPEFFVWTYQQRPVRHHNINTNGYNDYYPSEYIIEYD